MNKYKPVIVLTLICVIVAGLLGGVHMLTEGVIAGANAEVIKESLKSVMPEGEFDATPDTLSGDVPETVKAVYTDKGGGGCVVILETNKGYTGKNIGLSVAISNTGAIINMQITKNEESIVPQNMKPMGDYGSLYSGVTAENLMELETGATVAYTEGAIKNAINDAFVFLGYASEPKLPGLDEDGILDLILSKYLKGASLKDITPEEKETHLRKLYLDEASGNYVAYVATIAAYGGGLETDGIVVVDKSGKILTCDILTWKVGHDLVLPDGYTGQYIGKTDVDIESVELVSGATTTAQNFKNAVTDVLLALKKPSLPGLDEETVKNLILSDYLKGVSLEDITPDGAEQHLRKLYYDSVSGNYVAYVATIAAYGGGLETDGIIVVDKSGKIITCNMLTWKVGHDLALPEGYTEQYIGKTADSIESVELVSGATTTAGNFRTAVADVLSAVNEASPEGAGFAPEKILGVCVLLLTAAAITTAILYEKGIFTRGGRKNEK